MKTIRSFIQRGLTFVLFICLSFLVTAQTTVKLGLGDVTIKDMELVACHYDFNQNPNGTNIIISGDLTINKIKGTYPGIFQGKNITGVSITASLVDTIPEWTFADNNITSLTISNNIKHIGDFAFLGNKISNLTIGTSVKTIGNQAFANNLLTTLNVPNNVVEIQKDAFLSNKIETLILGERLKTIGYGAFYDNSINALVIPDSVETIGSTAFGNNNLLSLTLGKRVRSIGESAFEGNQLQLLQIPENVRVISSYAFSANNLESIQIDSGVQAIGNSAFTKNSLSEILFPNSVVSIGKDVATQQKDQKVVELVLPTPEGDPEIEWLDDRGDSYNSGAVVTKYDRSYYAVLDAYTLTNEDVEVVDSTIVKCTYSFIQKSIIIPEILDGQPVKRIANADDFRSGIFADKGIRQVQLPKTLREIGAHAFSSNRISHVDIPADVVLIGERAFSGNLIAQITLPIPDNYLLWEDGNGNDYYEAVISDFLPSYNIIIGYTLQDDDVEITDGIITSWTTATKTHLNIIVPKKLKGMTVRGIGDDVFSHRSDQMEIHNILLPSTLHSIGKSAFYGAAYLGRITIPDSVVSIDDNAFYNCDNLKEVKLPNRLTKIGISAFEETSLSSIDLPDSLTILGATAFRDTRITEMIIPPKLTEIEPEVFRGTSLKRVHIPKGIKKVGREAFYGCLTLTDLTFSEGLQVIEESAFSLTEIKALNFPETLREIGLGAFNTIGSITEVTIPNSVVKIHAPFFLTGVKSFVLPTPENLVGWDDGSGSGIFLDGGTIITGQDNFQKRYDAKLRYVLKGENVNINDEGVITAANPPSHDYYVIPDTLQGKVVKGVGPDVKLSGIVTLPSTLETIAPYAFLDRLEKFELPSSIRYIAQNAWNGIQLSTALLPKVDGALWTDESGLKYQGGDTVDVFINGNQNKSYTREIDKLVVLSITDEIDFGNITINDTGTASIKMFNNTFSEMNIVVSSDPNGFFIDGAKNLTIPSGDTIELVYKFIPVTTQAYTASVTLIPNNSVEDKDVITLRGEGRGREITVLPKVDLGTLTKDRAVNTTLTITNNGNETLNISNITTPGTISANWTSGDIDGGGSQDVNFTITPNNAGDFSENITIASNGHNETNTTVTFSAKVEESVRVLELSEDINFGTVPKIMTSDKHPDAIVTVRNKGNDDLQITNVVSSKDVDFTLTLDQALPWTISPDESLQFLVTFKSPSSNAVGTYNGVITVTSDATNTSIRNTVNVQGSVVNSNLSVVSLEIRNDYLISDVGSSTSTLLFVSNTGNQEMNLTNITSSNSQFSVNFQGATTIPIGDETPFQLTYTPTTAGNTNTTLNFVTEEQSSGTKSLKVSGFGNSKELAFSSTNVNFGEIDLTKDKTETITLTNTGNTTLTITDIQSPEGYTLSLKTLTIVPGGTADVDVKFTPTERKSYDGVLTFISDATGGNNSVSLSGVGSEKIIALSVVDFGFVDLSTSVTKQLTIQNTGNSPFTVTDVTSSDAQFVVSMVNNITINGGANATVDITFTPQQINETRATVTVTTQETVTGANSSTLLGYGSSRSLELSPNSLDFGDVLLNNKKTHKLTIRNSGNAPVTITDITSDDNQFKVNFSSRTLNGHEEVVVDVVYTATKKGNVSATLKANILNNTNVNTVNVTANGQSRELSYPVDPIFFGTVPLGQGFAKTITLKNPGNSPLTIYNFLATGGFLVLTNPQTIPAGGSIAVHVTFSPREKRLYNGQLIFNSNATNEDKKSNTILLSGLEESVALDKIDLDTVYVGHSTTKKLTVTNSESTALTLQVSSSNNQFSVTSDPIVVPANGSGQIDVTYTPTQKGISNAQLTLTTNYEVYKIVEAEGYGAYESLSPFLDVDIRGFGESCPSNDDGEIVVDNKSGKTVSAQLENGSPVAIPPRGMHSFTNLSSGSYSLVITEGSSNRRSINIKITEPSPLKVETHTTTGDSKSLRLSITGGNPPPYTVKVGDGTYTAYSRNVVIEDVPAGLHGIEVSDNNLCNDYTGEVFVIGDIKYYPNPVTDKLMIMLPKGRHIGGFYNVQIINSSGQVVSTQSIKSDGIHLNISFIGVSEGVYLVSVIQPNGVSLGEAIKIVVQ